jgi:hypothetical protein
MENSLKNNLVLSNIGIALKLISGHLKLKRINNGRIFFSEAFPCSTNGTFLSSGQRLSPGTTYTLRPGDRFYLATRETAFEL